MPPGDNGDKTRVNFVDTSGQDNLADLRLGGPAQKPPRETYLQQAVDASIGRTVASFTDNKDIQSAVNLYTREFVKLAPVLMRGGMRFAPLAAAAYASDEASPNDGYKTQLVDLTLGATKGLVLQRAFDYMGSRQLTPTMTGLQLGIASRLSDAALTRTNYFDQSGQFSLDTGFKRALSVAIRPENLAVDVLTFGAADVVWGRLYANTRGQISFNPIVKHAITGSMMGFTSGTGNEISNQFRAGHFDPVRLGESAIGGTLMGTLAGGLGGYQTSRATRIDYSKIGQRGLSQTPGMPTALDAEQIAFRDGAFQPTGKAANLTTETWTGVVTTPDGRTIPALFRPHDGTPTFQSRMHAETSGFGAGKIGLGESMPLAVARTVEVGGVQYPGYIQEMKGVDLNRYLSQRAQATYGSSSIGNMLKVYAENPSLQSAFKNAMGQRLVLGEWDNHALNMLVVENAGAAKIKNIDVSDALSNATSQAHMQPRTGILKGWEGLNSELYKQLAGKPISPEFKQDLVSFLKNYDTVPGRVSLQEQTGWSQPQIEGVIGRSKWFTENGIFPAAEQQSIAYPMLAAGKKALKSALKTAVPLDERRIAEQRAGD